MQKSRGPKVRLPVLILVLLATVPLQVAGQQAPMELSLAEAIRIARERNPSFQAVRNDEEVADWDVRSAYGSLIPSASVSSGLSWQGTGEQQFGSLTTEQLGFGDLPSYYFSSYNMGLTYSLSGRTLYRPAQARALRDATVASIREIGANLVRDVTVQYLEVLRQDEALRLAEQELERARFNLRLAEGQLEVGSATPRDVRQAEVAVGRAEVTLLQSRFGTQNARLGLLVLMGQEPDQEVRLTSTFDIEEPDWSDDELFAWAVDANPGLEALRAEESSAAVGVKSARSAYFPSLSLSAGLSGFTRQASSSDFLVAQARAGAEGQVRQCAALNELFVRLADPLPPQDCSAFALTPGQEQAIRDANSQFPFDFTRQPAQASLLISIPVFQGLTRQRDLEAARVQREDSRLRLRGRELALRAEISSSVAAVRTAFQTAMIEERNQEVAQEQLRLAREQYAVGSASFLDLVEAETVMAQADRQRLASVYSYHDLLANLEALVGRSFRNP